MEGERESAGVRDEEAGRGEDVGLSEGGLETERCDVASWAGFKPGRLPDTTGGGVPVGDLFAVEGSSIVSIVSAKCEGDRSIVLAEAMEVEIEGGVATLMLTGEEAIDPETGFPVDGAKDDVGMEVTLVPGSGNGDSATVPGGASVGWGADAGKSALPGEGNSNLALKRDGRRMTPPAGVFTLIVGIEGKLPRAVERDPVRTLKDGVGMFGSGKLSDRSCRGGRHSDSPFLERMER